MKRIKSFTAIMLSLMMAFTVSPLFAYAETEKSTAAPEYEAGQIVVMAESGTTKAQVREMAAKAEGRLISVSELGDGTKIALIKVGKGSEESAVSVLCGEENVLFAQPNYKYELMSAYPNDPKYVDGRQVYLSKDPIKEKEYAGSINAAGAWKRLGNKSLDYEDRVLVAVVDTGVRRSHEDLQECVISDMCVTFNNGRLKSFTAGDDSDDDIGHGTDTTGVIGADIDNGIGVAGVAGGRAKIFVIDAGSVTKGIDSIDIAMAIYYATDKGARVINLSVGGHTRDYMYERAVKYAWDNGTVCVCAAGNSGSSFIHWPGDSPYAINVMAHSWNGAPTSFTCYGIEKDISAPGEMLFTTCYLRNTSYESFDGTSAAAPIVTGCVALLLSKDPDLTPREIKNLLYTSSGKRKFSATKKGQSFGRVNIDTAMKNLLAEKTIPEKIVINKPAVSMYVGDDTSIEYAVYPGNTNCVEAQFTSSNTKVVTVDKDGVLKAKAPGTAEIRVTCKGVSTISKVTVKEKPYLTIDRKPFFTTGTITMKSLMDDIIEEDGTGQIRDENGVFYHDYHIDLTKGETISMVMYSNECEAFLRIKDADGNLVASDDINKSSKVSTLSFTAKKAGTYSIQAVQINGSGEVTSTDYLFKLASDKTFCDPTVTSTDYGQMRMRWSEVQDADCYLVRKYKDKNFSKIISEEYVDAAKYTDTSYNKKKVQYYSVTAVVQTVEGMMYSGEATVKVKMANTMTVKGKTPVVKAAKLKRGKVTLARKKVIKLSKAKGKKTYTLVSAKKGSKNFKKYFKVSKKTGKITVKKGLKKGTYKVKVKVRAAGNSSYRAKTKTVTVKVKVE